LEFTFQPIDLRQPGQSSSGSGTLRYIIEGTIIYPQQAQGVIQFGLFEGA
jgi:hypothetical protein